MKNLICVEGPDGTGKNTVVDKIYKELSKKTKIQKLHQPYNQYCIEKIKEALRNNDVSNQIYWFKKDRQMMLPLYDAILNKEGSHLILNRYYHSTCAYQYSALLGDSVRTGYAAQRDIIIKPHITLVLTCSPEVQARRLAERNEVTDLSKFEEKSEFREKVILAYKDMIGSVGFQDCVEIDTDSLSKQQVFEKCMNTLHDNLQF